MVWRQYQRAAAKPPLALQAERVLFVEVANDEFAVARRKAELQQPPSNAPRGVHGLPPAAICLSVGSRPAAIVLRSA